jgi:iron complex transport system substrate-binding protein
MRHLRSVHFLAAILFVVAACAPAAAPPSATTPSTPAPSAAHYPVTVMDDRGKSLTLTAAPTRVVSLAPSATEIVFALGASDRLIATDDFSDFPAEAKALPKLGGIRTSPDKIVALKPDLILLILSGNLPTQLDTVGQPIFVFDPNDIDGVYRNIATVGSLLDRDEAAQKIVADMRARIGQIGEKAKAATTRPRVLHEVDSTNPTQIFVAGPRNFIDSMITTVGGQNVASDAVAKYPKMSPEQIVARDPEIIVLADFRFGTTPEMVMARPAWGGITAVKNKAIYPIDDDLVSRPGPRLVLGFEAYAKLVHPEIFGRP